MSNAEKCVAASSTFLAIVTSSIIIFYKHRSVYTVHLDCVRDYFFTSLRYTTGLKIADGRVEIAPFVFFSSLLIFSVSAASYKQGVNLHVMFSTFLYSRFTIEQKSRGTLALPKY